MTAGLRAQAADCSVSVYLLTGVPMRAGILMDASTKAMQMFREIGVNVRMRDFDALQRVADSLMWIRRTGTLRSKLQLMRQSSATALKAAPWLRRAF